MTVRRFKLVFEDDGSAFHCAAFESEDAREQVLAKVQSVQLAPIDAVSQAQAEPRRPGRPSFDELLASAVDALAQQLDGEQVAAQARIVHAYLQERCDPEDALPALRTIEIFIGTYWRPSTRKLTRKIARKFRGV
jgi:hypothetical protein